MRALRRAALALVAVWSSVVASRADAAAVSTAPAPTAPALAPAPPVAWQDLFRSTDITVYLENDKFFAGTDRHYTNGFKLSFLAVTRLNESPAFVQAVANYIPTLTPQAALEQHYKVGVAIGQNIYTPTDTETAAPIPTDRPYAAWLYGALTFQAENRAHTLLRVVELELGMVGPAALGEEVQNGWHSIIHDPHAEGWSNQLHNEPGVVLSWERRYKVKRITFAESDLAAELIGRWGLSLGNVDTHLGAGMMLRAGWKMPHDFGPDLIRAAGGDAAPVSRSSFYFFTSAEGRAVGRNIFLDGNTWQSSASVEKRPIVGDFDTGMVLRCPWRTGKLRGLQLVYSENYRTKEFYGQLQRDVFGSISISLLF